MRWWALCWRQQQFRSANTQRACETANGLCLCMSMSMSATPWIRNTNYTDHNNEIKI